VLALDEVAESVRADVAEHETRLAGRNTADADLVALRRQAALLPAAGDPAPRAIVLTVSTAALDVAAAAERLLARPPGTTSADDRRRFAAADARLEEATDRGRTELEGLVAVEQRLATAQRHRGLAVLAVVGVTGTLLVAGAARLIGRRLVRSLEQLSAVARAVADGDLTARADSAEAGEVGDLARVFDEMAATLETAFVRLAQERAHQEFQARVDRAFENLDSEDELSGVLARAMSAVHPELPMELLVADSSESHLARMTVSERAGAACCPVDSPWSCPAVRSGRTLHQPSGDELDACPKLRGRAGGPHSAVCVPVAFMGRSLGVLHAVGPAQSTLPDAVVANMQVLAERTGSRLGTLRAFARAERQASTDGLTGLQNRRSFEDRVRMLSAAGRRYAVLLADLDHFKQLNDGFGHDTGDRALRMFADVLRGTLRSGDLCARYGGEEFVVAIPDHDAEAGLQAAERLRVALAVAVAGPDVPSFTVSVGVADSTLAPTLSAQLRVADVALLRAKREGRDRCIVGDPDAALIRDGEPLLPAQRHADG
jgi:diguanylate cyclase (GGDEF)-like protein